LDTTVTLVNLTFYNHFTMARRVKIEPLTYDGFKPFGTVVQNPVLSGSSIQAVDANQGTARKYGDISPISNFYHLASSQQQSRPAMSMFVCSPRQLQKRGSEWLLNVKLVERHPFTTQTFVPIGVECDSRETQYLVVVAPTLSTQSQILGGGQTCHGDQIPKGPGNPDLVNIRVFLARGNQAVTYGAGTWHAPMIVIGKRAIEFVVTQFVNGVANDDCQEVEISPIEVDVRQTLQNMNMSRL
jgi:ureidoglycolate lyase